MKLGNSTFVLSIFLLFFCCLPSFAEDKILSAPLINLNELKPSFEETDNLADDVIDNNAIKNKKVTPTAAKSIKSFFSSYLFGFINEYTFGNFISLIW